MRRPYGITRQWIGQEKMLDGTSTNLSQNWKEYIVLSRACYLITEPGTTKHEKIINFITLTLMITFPIQYFEH